MEKIVKKLADEINIDAFFKTKVSVLVTVKKALNDGTIPVVLKIKKYNTVGYEQTCNGFEEARMILNALKFQLAYERIAG